MYKELPIVWQKKLENGLNSIRENGFCLFNDDSLKTRTLSFLLTFDETQNQKLHEFIELALPGHFKNKCILQPFSGYHASIQWSLEYEETDLEGLKAKITEYTKSTSINLKVDILGLYPSDNNLFLVLVPNREGVVANLRTDISNIFQESRAITKLPADLDTLWISVVRFSEQPTAEEREELINCLPKFKFEKIGFDRAVLALNDPFFTTENSLRLTEIVL